MKYEAAGAFRAALEKRLASTAGNTGVPLVRLRKLVVFDRLLARLMVVAPDRWIVKGAVALLLRAGPTFRTTKDVDLARQDNEDEATADLVAAQSLTLGDYFSFAATRTTKLDVMPGVAAVRYHVSAELAGRTFDEITVDVGFGGPYFAEPDLVRGPDLLSFADIPPIEVPALPIEQHIAEKVHAYTRTYGTTGQVSTRVKDLVDIVLISSLFSLQAGRMHRALSVTFDDRGTHDLPTSLPPPPTEWRTAYRQIAAEVVSEPDLSLGFEQARTFLDPVLSRTAEDNAQWNPAQRRWE